MKRNWLWLFGGCVVLVCFVLLLNFSGFDHPERSDAPVYTATVAPTSTPTLSPTPSPEPTSTPTPSPLSNFSHLSVSSESTPTTTPFPDVFGGFGSSLSGSVYVDVFFTDKASSRTVQFSPDKEMLHSQQNGMIGDGVLFFSGVAKFVKTADIRTVPFTKDFMYSVTFDEDVSSSSFGHVLYQQTRNGLVMLEGSDQFVFGQDTLESGTYLLKIDFSVSQDSAYYSGSSFVWLLVEKEQ